MEKEIINKVAQSGLITIDLEEFYTPGERILLDIKPWLFQEMILKEKDFRDHIAKHDWTKYRDKFVAVTCTADAIIPTWAYILIATAVQPFAKKIVYGNLEVLETILYEEALNKIDYSKYQDSRVIIKGCGKLPVPIAAYVQLASNLKPYVKSLMYGEACSTVPLYKKK